MHLPNPAAIPAATTSAEAAGETASAAATNTPRVPSVIAIMGSYRDDGVISHLTRAVIAAAAAAGAETEIITLKERHIEFCTNCRQCMQLPGPQRGLCFHNDDMEAILQRLDKADALVLAAPVNMWNVNALTRQFMERCAGYAYWPWGTHAPRYRHNGADKKAVLISASGAPALAAQWLSGAQGALKALARLLGAKPIGTLWQGKINERQRQLDIKVLDKAERLGRELTAP